MFWLLGEVSHFFDDFVALMGQAMQKYDKQRQAWEIVDLR